MGFDLGKGFIDSLINARTGAFSHLEDFADRLSHFFSCGIILMLAGVTMANVYFLRPIACTLPTAPENKFNEFAESVCWVRGTVAIRDDDFMPNSFEDWEKLREKTDLSFYQWVPFCLSVQAMLFFLPHAIWQSLAMHTMGENLESILELARKANLSDDNCKRVKCVHSAAYQLFRLSRQHLDTRSTKWAETQRKLAQIPGGTLFIVGKRMGNCVSLAYLFVKLLYLTNAIGQLYIIRTFLGHSGNLFSFGDALIGTLTAKREWGESEFFPRQTYCPVNVRHLGTKNNVFTAICALPVNMFNEKIYIFLWLWIAAVTIITSISLVLWLGRLSIHSCQNTFIRNYLLVSISAQLLDTIENHDSECEGCYVRPDDERIDQFILEFVRNDGFFLLRMIRANAGDVISGEILNEWWHFFVNYDKAKRKLLNKQKNSKINNLNEKIDNIAHSTDEHTPMIAPTAPLIYHRTANLV